MKTKIQYLKDTIDLFYKDTLNGDVFPVFNAFYMVMRDQMIQVNTLMDFNQHDYVIYDFDNQKGLTCSVEPYQNQGRLLNMKTSLRVLMEEVLLNDDIDVIKIDIDDTHIVMDHELIMYCLKHVPVSNVTFLVSEDELPVDFTAIYSGNGFDTPYGRFETFDDIIDLCSEHISRSVELNGMPLESFEIIFKTFKANMQVINFYVKCPDQKACDDCNNLWNALFNDDEIYDNKDLYEGGRLFKNKQYEESYQLFNKAAHRLNPGALSNLGYCNEKGLGVSQSMMKATMYYEMAASYYETYALMKLATFIYQKDQWKASHYLRLAYCFAKVDKEFYSYPDICYYMALYEEQLPDYERIAYLNEAIDHYRQAIDDGHDYQDELDCALILKDSFDQQLVS